jgi:hypothetical protein
MAGLFGVAPAQDVRYDIVGYAHRDNYPTRKPRLRAACVREQEEKALRAGLETLVHAIVVSDQLASLALAASVAFMAMEMKNRFVGIFVIWLLICPPTLTGFG